MSQATQKVLDPDCGCLDSLPAQSTWTFWWSDWQWDRRLSTFIFPYQIIITQTLHTHLALSFMHESAYCKLSSAHGWAQNTECFITDTLTDYV